MITKQEQTTHAGKKTQEDFFIKYFTAHFICKVSKRVTQSLRVRGSWGPNITEIFWPRSYGRQRCVFLVLHGCSTGPWSKLFCVLAFPTTPRLPPSSTVLLALLLAHLQLSSIRRPYITFKLPRSNIDTPQRLRNLFRFPATGMCHFLPEHHLEWHFWPGQKVKTEQSFINYFSKFHMWNFPHVRLHPPHTYFIE